MEKVSTLAFHPVKMQACYQQVERLSLEGLQQRFHVCSPAVFVQRAQVLMREVRLGPRRHHSNRPRRPAKPHRASRLTADVCPSPRQQMDAAVYTFEQILHQSLEAQGTEDLCKTIQRCQDRVLKVSCPAPPAGDSPLPPVSCPCPLPLRSLTTTAAR